MKGWIGVPGRLDVTCPVSLRGLKHLDLPGGGQVGVYFEVGWLENAVYNVFGATWGGFRGRLASECSTYIIFLVPFGEGRQGLFRGRLANHTPRRWVGSLFGKGLASPVPSQALKPPGAPRLETTTTLVARGGFMLIN